MTSRGGSRPARFSHFERGIVGEDQLVLSQRGGPIPSFPSFLYVKNTYFLPKGGPWPIWPRGKYATGHNAKMFSKISLINCNIALSPLT